MYFRQIAIATALYAIIALVGATARVPSLDSGILDGNKKGNQAYNIEPDITALVEEGIVP